MKPIIAISLLVAAGLPRVLTLDDFEKKGERPPLVDVRHYIPDARLDIHYATDNNVCSKPVYEKAVCFVRPEVGEAVKAVDEELKKQGFRLLIWDCYRPYSVQKVLYRAGPPGLFANPSHGSHHNRGAAVDAGLVALDGSAVPLPTDFDASTPEAASGAALKDEAAQRNRELLKKVMRAHGFRTINKEWWHFNYKGAGNYPLLDIPLDKLEAESK